MSGNEAAPPAKPERLEAVDLLRGVVLVLMALDHVRDFFSDRLHLDPVDLETTTWGIFLTRWVTHYCAPTFIFLAGTSAYLSGTRGRTNTELSRFLFTRGLWLAFFEVVINRMMWMFSFDFVHHGAGVFWAIGWSMVVLSVLVYLPTPVVTIFGVSMIALHNLLDGLKAAHVGLPEWLWVILHQPGEARLVGEITFGTGYCLIPWAGVMAAGYGFGALLRLDRGARRKCVFALGAALTVAFVALRTWNHYGDWQPWSEQPTRWFTLLSFLNCTKYPPSLLFLLMTLGPAVMALSLFDRPLGPLASPFLTFGRVPLFFYLLHIPLIHGGAVLLDILRFGWLPQAADGPWAVGEAMEKGLVPPSYGVGLWAVYLIWVGVVLVLYPACHWYAGVKRRRRDWWLAYL